MALTAEELREALDALGSALPSDADSYAFHGAMQSVFAAARLVLAVLEGEIPERVVEAMLSIEEIDIWEYEAKALMEAALAEWAMSALRIADPGEEE